MSIGGGWSYRCEKSSDWLGKVLHDDAHQAEGALSTGGKALKKQIGFFAAIMLSNATGGAMSKIRRQQ